MKNLIDHSFEALFAGVFIAFCWLGNALQAQNATVTKIRATYNEIQEKITECANSEEPEVCRLYLNTLNVNQKHSPWAAVGNYGATRDFWFERGSGEGENGPRYVLRKINIQTSRSAHQESEEYL
ncbi:MAG TPA: hypothetical protein VHS96_18830, partial [Bacteroidia bacterium]|nr:hypothetical protein [Bacteroidia bacterium]